jgi:hypothetical protein
VGSSVQCPNCRKRYELVSAPTNFIGCLWVLLAIPVGFGALLLIGVVGALVNPPNRTPEKQPAKSPSEPAKEPATKQDKVISAPPKDLVQHPAQPTEKAEEALPMPLVVDTAAIQKAEADKRKTVALNEKNEKAALVQFKIAESFLTDAEKARFKGDLQTSDRLTNSARQWFRDVITAYPNTVAATEAKKRLNSK